MGEGILDSVVLLTVLPLKNVVVLIFFGQETESHTKAHSQNLSNTQKKKFTFLSKDTAPL